MVLKTLVYSPFIQLTQLMILERFTEFSRRESLKLNNSWLGKLHN
jgi:hypothetical protein